MNFDVLSVKRYSVRKFDPAPVEPEKLARILEAGRIAPTAANKQPQRILVVTQTEGLAKIDRSTPCRFGAPLVLVVCYDKNECAARQYDGEPSGWVDASIIATHMMLQAADIGIGSTWVMHFDPAVTREEFSLPENLVPVAMLVMGRPAPDAAPADRHTIRHPLEKIVYFEKIPTG
ncbi:MAG: nitroreductase family protein [Spirochaetaceae bacterium]|jgi:nitroreductase|nr:nitroreductase family protein [Spirochaetaceae bacterium]